jgi:hypothetical protein
MKYILPEPGLRSFTCPHCGVIARHYHWGYPNEVYANPYQEALLSKTFLQIARCEHCELPTVWAQGTQIYPSRGGAPLPNPHMPEKIKADYEEAATICVSSPRGAAALLRLAIQKLCIHLGGSGENLNQDIALLVRNGLPVQVQQALDVVRVIGNNAVHPGQIEANDHVLAAQLFPLVNVIVEYMIALPLRVSGLFENLPPGAKAAIEKRDR